jgi:hypothetical protein
VKIPTVETVRSIISHSSLNSTLKKQGGELGTGAFANGFGTLTAQY